MGSNKTASTQPHSNPSPRVEKGLSRLVLMPPVPVSPSSALCTLLLAYFLLPPAQLESLQKCGGVGVAGWRAEALSGCSPDLPHLVWSLTLRLSSTLTPRYADCTGGHCSWFPSIMKEAILVSVQPVPAPSHPLSLFSPCNRHATYYVHCSGKNTKAQRGLLTTPRPHSQLLLW